MRPGEQPGEPLPGPTSSGHHHTHTDHHCPQHLHMPSRPWAETLLCWFHETPGLSSAGRVLPACPSAWVTGTARLGLRLPWASLTGAGCPPLLAWALRPGLHPRTAPSPAPGGAHSLAPAPGTRASAGLACPLTPARGHLSCAPTTNHASAAWTNSVTPQPGFFSGCLQFEVDVSPLQMLTQAWSLCRPGLSWPLGTLCFWWPS